MQRTVVVAVVVYVLLLASPATPLYEPLWSGHDDQEALIALLIVLGATHLGVGALLRSPWVLLLPVVLVVVGFIAAGAQGLAWLTLVLEGPVLIAITARGWLLGLRKLSCRRSSHSETCAPTLSCRELSGESFAARTC